ncbi:two pore domain potassium channel family protein [Pseudoteredinibacter isoporae]|nr:two pore domain potassium channel family protein [Pseudoteredinibacter isoporae]NIB22671.1 two pore domain potassium channel family protein [Pseudoteredinibacter isoporae]
MFHRLRRIIFKYFMDLGWRSILVITATYISSVWLMLYAAKETQLLPAGEFFYWLLVTASTVGYGDLSPITPNGKLITAFYVIPLGLGLFGLAIGRIAAFMSYQWRKSVQGLKPVNCKDHILLVGWNESRTLELIKLLLREMEHQAEKRKIVLCVKVDIENPMPEQIAFVKVSSHSKDEEMDRASVSEAASIIIDNSDDDATMTAALYCTGRNPDAHTIAYFNQEKLGQLLKKHCPNVECMPSVAIEMIAKSTMDPGSSALHHELLDVDQGMTQYSILYDGDETISIGDVFPFMKSRYEATLIGIKHGDDEELNINPCLSEEIAPGDRIFYIADERIASIHWQSLNTQ